MPSEEELEQLRKSVTKKREQVASQNAKEAENLAERQREIEFAELLVEEARLENELTRAREAAKVGTSRDSVTNLLASSEEQLKAEEARAQVGLLVDTNAEDQPKNTTGATTAVEGGIVSIAPDGTASVEAPPKEESKSSSTSTSSTATTTATSPSPAPVSTPVADSSNGGNR